jgi:membrane fusion protein (multidrug efflux system)
MIRRVIYFLIVTLILGGLAGAIGFYAFDFKPKMLVKIITGTPRPPETVSAEAAITESWQPQIAAIGTLAATEGIDIAPQVGGVVQKVEFDSGQSVKKGQLLLVLNSDTEQADKRSLQAQLDNANVNLDRRDVLVSKGVAPRNDLDSLRTQTLTLQASIDRLQAQIEQKSIYAPWDGMIGLRNVSLGGYLPPGKSIAWLQKTDPIYVDFTVTEADLARVEPGMPVVAKFKAWPDATFTGKVTTRDTRVSDQSRMITVRAELANPDGRLLPGMYADVLVQSGAPQQVTTVPLTALTFSLYGDNVLVATPDADPAAAKLNPPQFKIERRFVKVGDVRDDRIQVISGIQPGDQVITGGQNKIDQGSKVVINNSIALKAPDANTLQ